MVKCYICGSEDVWSFNDIEGRRLHVCYSCDETWEADDEDCLGTITPQQFYNLCSKMRRLEEITVQGER